jgi:hypothetical protein
MPTMALSPTQKGKIAEMVVGAAFMHASDGRLAPFVPLADDDGLDIILFDKLSGMTTPVQVKARFSVDTGNTCEFNIRAAAYKEHYRAYLLAVHIDPRTMALDGIWLIPMNALPVVAPMKNGKYVLIASMADDANDRAAPYRHLKIDTVVSAIAPSVSAREPWSTRKMMGGSRFRSIAMWHRDSERH